jgi:hypothetical protein
MATEASLQLTHDPVHQCAMARIAGLAPAPRLCASTLCHANTCRHQLAQRSRATQAAPDLATSRRCTPCATNPSAPSRPRSAPGPGLRSSWLHFLPSNFSLALQLPDVEHGHHLHCTAQPSFYARLASAPVPPPAAQGRSPEPACTRAAALRTPHQAELPGAARLHSPPLLPRAFHLRAHGPAPRLGPPVACSLASRMLRALPPPASASGRPAPGPRAPPAWAARRPGWPRSPRPQAAGQPVRHR